jgi:hypothetical protein
LTQRLLAFSLIAVGFVLGRKVEVGERLAQVVVTVVKVRIPYSENGRK